MTGKKQSPAAVCALALWCRALCVGGDAPKKGGIP